MARPMLEMRSLLPEFFMPRGCTTADENAAQIPRNREYTVRSGLISWETRRTQRSTTFLPVSIFVASCLCGEIFLVAALLRRVIRGWSFEEVSIRGRVG